MEAGDISGLDPTGQDWESMSKETRDFMIEVVDSLLEKADIKGEWARFARIG